MILPTPANDRYDIQPDDMWAGCLCGSMLFSMLWRRGLFYVLCASCGYDMTNTTIWGKNSATD